MTKLPWISVHVVLISAPLFSSLPRSDDISMSDISGLQRRVLGPEGGGFSPPPSDYMGLWWTIIIILMIIIRIIAIVCYYWHYYWNYDNSFWLLFDTMIHRIVDFMQMSCRWLWGQLLFFEIGDLIDLIDVVDLIFLDLWTGQEVFSRNTSC